VVGEGGRERRIVGFLERGLDGPRAEGGGGTEGRCGARTLGARDMRSSSKGGERSAAQGARAGGARGRGTHVHHGRHVRRVLRLVAHGAEQPLGVHERVDVHDPHLGGGWGLGFCFCVRVLGVWAVCRGVLRG